MPQYQFRVTEESDERIRELTILIRSNSTALMIVKEIGGETEKKHIHALIDISNKSTFVQKFHKQFRKCEDGKFVPRYSGNKSYSCEELKKLSITVLDIYVRVKKKESIRLLSIRNMMLRR